MPKSSVSEHLTFPHGPLDDACQSSYFLTVLSWESSRQESSPDPQGDKDTYQGSPKGAWLLQQTLGPSPCSCSFCFFFSSFRSLTLRSLALPMPPAWRMDSSRVARPLEGSATSLGAP